MGPNSTRVQKKMMCGVKFPKFLILKSPKKMKNLIGQFYGECKKAKSGAGADEVINSKWLAYDSMSFLKDKNKPCETSEAGIEVSRNIIY